MSTTLILHLTQEDHGVRRMVARQISIEMAELLIHKPVEEVILEEYAALKTSLANATQQPHHELAQPGS